MSLRRSVARQPELEPIHQPNQYHANVMKLSKIFLTISIVAGVVGWTSSGAGFGFGILRPFSAVFFILFFVSTIVEHAEQDHRERTQAKQTERVAERSPGNASSGTLAGAH